MRIEWLGKVGDFEMLKLAMMCMSRAIEWSLLIRQRTNKSPSSKIPELTRKSGFNRVAGNLFLRIMFKAIDVWKKLDDTTAIRYRCFERLEDRQFCVQSADYYYLPLRQEQVKALDQQFVELFIEEAPDERSSLYPSLETAIAQYDVEFADDFAPVYLERQAM
jgi:hypothetical protein